jgi:hypothetical protein
VSEDAGIEYTAVATTALADRRYNHSARSHPLNHCCGFFFWIFLFAPGIFQSESSSPGENQCLHPLDPHGSLLTYPGYLFTCVVVSRGPGRASQGTSSPEWSRSNLSFLVSPLSAAGCIWNAFIFLYLVRKWQSLVPFLCLQLFCSNCLSLSHGRTSFSVPVCLSWIRRGTFVAMKLSSLC